MNDTFSFALESPLTEEQINLITDAEFEHTDRIWFDTPKGKHIEFVKAPQWIPCSERLPEEDDYKSCIECLDGAVWYFTENGTMGIGYYYESTKEWSTTDDLKTDGKVIAWMPLPEPYAERQEE